jgi:AGZA family xanthine/uracil permease-like MFS transporter
VRTLNSLFDIHRHQTTLTREIVAGLTTFTTMSYIVVVNPAILAAAGIPEGPAFTATVSVAAFGCYLMAFLRQSPFCHRALHGRERLHCLYRLQAAWLGKLH